jgi:ATP-dependent DNA helicase RecQ
VPAAPDQASLDEVIGWLRGADVRIKPRLMWPPGVDGRSGRIAADRRADEGRALAFADDPGWSAVVARLARADAPDGPVSDEVLRGVVGVLTRWRATWGERPVAVVPVPSRTHPLLVDSLAAGVADVGRLPVVRALTASGARAPSDVASGPRVQGLLGSLALSGEPVPAGPVLLVDDTARSTWTLTVAADLLRGAGATAVLPLVLHQLP